MNLYNLFTKQELIELFEQGHDYTSIGLLYNTTKNVIRLKANRLGLKYSDFSSFRMVKFNCPNCKKEINCKKSERKSFCNSSCSAIFYNLKRIHTEETKNKIRLKNLGRKYIGREKIFSDKFLIARGIDPATKGISRESLLPNCKVCGDKCKSYTAIYCSMNCRFKCKDLRNNLRDKCIERYKKNPEMHPNRKCAGIKESYPEKMFCDYLNLLGLVNGKDYFKQYKLGKYFIDVVIPKKNLAIEIDGERWHNQNDEREIKRENFIKNTFKLRRFSAKDIIKKSFHEEIKNMVS